MITSMNTVTHIAMIILTFGSDVMSLKASVTCLDVAPPPTSRKLAGWPPCNLIMSIVAIAKPAPFTTMKYDYHLLQ